VVYVGFYHLKLTRYLLVRKRKPLGLGAVVTAFLLTDSFPLLSENWNRLALSPCLYMFSSFSSLLTRRDRGVRHRLCVAMVLFLLFPPVPVEPAPFSFSLCFLVFLPSRPLRSFYSRLTFSLFCRFSPWDWYSFYSLLIHLLEVLASTPPKPYPEIVSLIPVPASWETPSALPPLSPPSPFLEHRSSLLQDN